MTTQHLKTEDAPIAYDVLTAAKKVGVGRSTIFDEISSGNLIARKVGRRTLIRHEDLVAWTAALPARLAYAQKRSS
ncbi:helix-turn-helix domain-containing protein [Methylobacterium sp. WL18]|nr:helix-turn-helix domain-containing protein [Methylobacterium sp. WL18]TXN72937.1 helix-turn-helix domain-containing protein [Methylobacterium sp. WL18]